MILFAPIFIAVFFLSLHYGAIIYVNSSLLAGFFDPNVVSILFLVGAAGSVALFLFAPRIIARFGKRLPLFFFLGISLLSILGLAFLSLPLAVVASFLAYSSTSFLIYYFLDIFLEERSSDAQTGEIRGIYFTFINLGIAAGPLLLVLFGGYDTLRPLYLSASALLALSIVATFFFKTSRETKELRQDTHHLPSFSSWWRDRNIRGVTLAKLVLEFFFAFMVIYTPIYLHQELGFAWTELGIIFAVALIPFVIFEWPAGVLADRFFGEKEIMGAGFLITGLSLIVMPFLGKFFVAWMVVLFISRVGAALIEVMTESYFFKHVEGRDTGLISVFRLVRPLSIVLASIVGMVSINLFSFEKIFIVLAVVVFFGLKESQTLVDTK